MTDHGTAGRAAGGTDERPVRRLIGGLLVVSITASCGLAATYALGGQVQVEGALLGTGLGGLAVAGLIWARTYLPHDPVVGPRDDVGSSPADVRAMEQSFEEGLAPFTRRSLLRWLFGGAAGAFGASLAFPIRSLGPGPGRSLFHTAWTPGARLVDSAGKPVHVGALEQGAVLTVFPEGNVTDYNSQTLLIRVDPAGLRARPGRQDWSPQGHVAYSKICTHVGCPVGLYRETTHDLLCPCHQSTFDVLDGARPVSGPATRSLPQLPLAVDEAGYLIAQRDYTEPVGPGFWDR